MSRTAPVLLRTLLVGLVVVVTSCGGGGGFDPGEGEPEDPFQPPDGPDVRLDTDPHGAALSIFPEICCAGDNVYVVWYDRRAPDTDVHFNRSHDGGETWLDTDARLDTDPPGEAGSNVPRICCAGDRVYVVWSDQRGPRSQIRFNTSVDAGDSWLAADVRLDHEVPEEGSSWNPEIACAGDAVYVVWQDARHGASDIFFNRSLDGGTTWLGADVRLNSNVEGTAFASFPRIACSGSTVYVVWQDDRQGAEDIRFNRSLDGGDSWLGADVRLDTDTAGAAASTAPTIACDGAQVCVVWTDARVDRRDVHSNASSDSGDNWLLTDNRLDTDLPGDATSLVPEVVCAGTEVYAVWQDFRDGFSDIRFSRSTDGGVSWFLEDVRLDTDPRGSANSLRPRLAYDGGFLHVVWYDDREGAWDVLLATSPDGGTTWPDEETRLDTDELGSENSVAPVVCATGASARAAWYDQRDGPGDIYFNRSPEP